MYHTVGTRSKRMHWMDARALRRKDAFKGERPWGDIVCDAWGERPTKIGYSWFSMKSISVERIMSMARGSDRAMITRRWAWKQPSIEESVIAHRSSSMAPKMYQGSSDSPKRQDLQSYFFKYQ
ncbi:hypothetical protein V6N12_034592 [Hibiscus sabdariffa]|uniref:Uncharacterized protein n=1 Tax=Hibiscus sabdariffa TaxID=183260 RepID=A0ABR2DJ83_9ROSI